jgi:hypothetical protein
MATEEIAEYAAAVRAALADIPDEDRAELLDDLDDHLEEVAAESVIPLVERLGPPEVFAAELRAAYGAGSDRGSGRRPTAAWHAAVARGRSVHRRSLDHTAYREVVAFLPELRPGWWVVRGFLAAMLVWNAVGWGLLPGNPVALLTALLPIWLSVRVGRRTRGRRPPGWGRGLLIVVNTAGAIVMIAFFGHLQSVNVGSGGGTFESATPASASDSGDITNIFPYSKDGKPLHDVLLYDQNGQPLLADYGQDGEQLIQPCGGPPPIANSYPLRLEQVPGSGGLDNGQPPSNFTDPNGDPVPCSSVSPAPSPSLSAAPHVSASPGASASPAPRSGGTPSPSPSRP